jgi:hypothetical protein
MYDLLFNVPWWIPTVLGIVAIALMVNGNRQQNERIRAAGAGIAVLAVGWAVVSYLVDTPKETCIKQTRTFVQSVVARDWMTFDGLLDPEVQYHFVGIEWDMQGRDRLDTAVRADVDKIRITSASVTSLTASDKNETVTTKFTVFSVQEETMGQMINSDWEFDWHKASSGRWVVSAIRCKKIGNLDAADIRNTLPVK